MVEESDSGSEAEVDSVRKLAGMGPGEDPEDPYEGTDVTQLPDWWQRAIREWEQHDFRPYRPPKFSDGELAPECIGQLEAELDVEIKIIGINISYGDDWVIAVDEEPIESISRHRNSRGYTVYEMTSEELERSVREYVGDEDSSRYADA